MKWAILFLSINQVKAIFTFSASVYFFGRINSPDPWHLQLWVQLAGCARALQKRGAGGVRRREGSSGRHAQDAFCSCHHSWGRIFEHGKKSLMFWYVSCSDLLKMQFVLRLFSTDFTSRDEFVFWQQFQKIFLSLFRFKGLQGWLPLQYLTHQLPPPPSICQTPQSPPTAPAPPTTPPTPTTSCPPTPPPGRTPSLLAQPSWPTSLSSWMTQSTLSSQTSSTLDVSSMRTEGKSSPIFVCKYDY